MKTVAGEGKKSAKCWAPPFGAPPFGAPKGGASPFGAPTFSRFGPPPFGAPTLCGPKIQHQKLAEVEIGRSGNWPKSKLAEVELAELEEKSWPKLKLAEVDRARHHSPLRVLRPAGRDLEHHASRCTCGFLSLPLNLGQCARGWSSPPVSKASYTEAVHELHQHLRPFACEMLRAQVSRVCF